MSRWQLATWSLAAALVTSVALRAQQPPPQPAPAGDIVGVGNFAHIVADVVVSAFNLLTDGCEA